MTAPLPDPSIVDEPFAPDPAPVAGWEDALVDALCGLACIAIWIVTFSGIGAI